MSALRVFLLGSPWSYRLVRLLLAAVFIWAGATKLMDPRAFARLISGYGLVPESMLVPVAVGLPILELAAGIGLIFDVRGALSGITGLIALFLSVLGFGIFNNLDVDCGCFSLEELKARDGLWTAFCRDVGLLSMALYLFLRRTARTRSWGWGKVSGSDLQLCEEDSK